MTPSLVAFVVLHLPVAGALDISHMAAALPRGIRHRAGVGIGLMASCLAGLLPTAVAAAIVKRDIELAYRRGFLENALLSELAARDGLTGLMNRRAFDEHLCCAWLQALHDETPLSIFMIDIDYFKSYNDRYGHLAGDAALRSVARAVQPFARHALEFVARDGGEEFVVIAYDLTLPQTRELPERLRASISQRAPASELYRPLTASLGVGYAVSTRGRSPEGVVQLADEALYRAKKAGRNRAVVNGVEAYALLSTGRFPAPHGRNAAG